MTMMNYFLLGYFWCSMHNAWWEWRRWSHPFCSFGSICWSVLDVITL